VNLGDRKSDVTELGITGEKVVWAEKVKFHLGYVCDCHPRKVARRQKHGSRLRNKAQVWV
jgi:hypothetical protein